ncbi:hypothetical protein ABW20_dc0107075 [Dactylellina cionopaga]|nr:hypothetical protein ABW20_dc0107075 [Dactylellina cionopaga]
MAEDDFVNGLFCIDVVTPSMDDGDDTDGPTSNEAVEVVAKAEVIDASLVTELDTVTVG